MKQTTQLLSLSLVTATLLLVGCTKPNNKRTPDTSNNPGINTSPPPTSQAGLKIPAYTLFAELRSTPQVYCITAGIPQSVTGTKGTILRFYPNSFKYANGNTVTDGTVCIELVEMLTPGAMIANMATTQTTDYNMLQSGGQVIIKATKNGEILYANKYGISMPQPAASTLSMDLYYGNRNNADSVLLWRPLDPATSGGTGTTATGTEEDTTSIIYIFDSSTEFNGVNLDRFLSFSLPRTKLKFNLPDTSFSILNTCIFLIFPEINGLVHLEQKNRIGGVSYFSSNTEISVGQTFNYVAISKKANGKYYYYEKTNYTIPENMNVDVTLTEQSLEYITTQLGGM
jgi:hypothetical protein